MTNNTPLPELVEPWLVFSWEHDAFWRPNRCGYTRFIEKAGRYSRKEAEAICKSADFRAFSEPKRDDPDTPPPEICFPASAAAEALTRTQASGGANAALLDELRAERDALLRKPIDLAKMDSVDDDNGTPGKMVAYYWWQQAQDARGANAALIEALDFDYLRFLLKLTNDDIARHGETSSSTVRAGLLRDVLTAALTLARDKDKA
jgi:hypothetical protein